MIRVAIVEDDDSFASDVKDYLRQFAQETGEKIDSVRYTDGDALVTDYKGNYDIILMDIEMGLMNGTEAAELVRSVDDEVTIIFVTNMAQYAIKGYAVRALDYLLKPISYPAFSECLKKAVSRIRKKQEGFVTVVYREGMIKLPAATITYVESRGHRLAFHTDTQTYETTTCTMREIEDKLSPCGFARISSGVLVNLNKVTEMQNGMVCIGEQKLRVSRGRKNEFWAALVSHMVE